MIKCLQIIACTFLLGAAPHSSYPTRPTVELVDLISQKGQSDIIRIAYGSCYGKVGFQTEVFKQIAGIE